MELQLSDREEALLVEFLRDHQKHLLHEIAKAHHHDYKLALRERYDVLEAILGKMQALPLGV